MKIAIIGYGYWGPNLARNIASLDGVSLGTVCDTSAPLLAKAQKDHPLASVTGSVDDVLADGSIDAVCIATSARTHSELSLRALRAGKHVLVEKPMATSAEDCEAMAREAEKRSLVLMVDHTFVYSGSVRKLVEFASGDGEGGLGNLYYFDSVRINMGIVQSDVSVLWDLAVHDLSILFQLDHHVPISVSASGTSHIQRGLVDTAYLTLHYDSAFLAHIHVSWLAPVKIRRTTIAGDRKMAIYDDTEATEKLKVYDSRLNKIAAGKEDLKEFLVEYRVGDITVPKLDSSEPLSLLVMEFRDAIRENRTPLVGAEEGARIVRILEAADRSLKRNGERVPL